MIRNLTIEENRAIKSLQNNKDIIIKPADKGSGIVILDKSAKRQLNNIEHYIPLPHSIQKQTQLQKQDILNQLHLEKFIDSKQKHFLMGPDTPRPRLFYLLPKIHASKEQCRVISPGEGPSCRIVEVSLNI